jgi:hypothetical protein
MSALNWTNTSYLWSDYSTSSSGYSATEIGSVSVGAEPVQPDAITPGLFGEKARVVFTVIDGELCLIKDDSPAGAKLPDAHLFARFLSCDADLLPPNPSA